MSAKKMNDYVAAKNLISSSHKGEPKSVSKLIAHEHVRSPAAFTQAFIAGYLENLKDPHAVLRLRLRVPTAQLGLGGGVMLERDVVASVAWASAGDTNPKLTIAWEPESGGLFPTFSGSLWAKTDDTLGAGAEEGSVLILSGDYNPPGGLAGEVFDSAIGFWIARATARDLLQRLRDVTETDYDKRRDF